MATATKYEESGTRVIRYECNSCWLCGMEYLPAVCPSCGKKFTKVYDEVELTHAHNDAIEAYNVKKTDESFEEMVRLGVQRFLFESESN